MERKKGLGRGLGALLGDYGFDEDTNEAERPTQQDYAQMGVHEVSLALIDRNHNQPRKNFDEAAMQELTNSIRMHGVITPIVLVKRDKRYMIIAGERRWRAAKAAGLLSIPAVVRDFDEQQIKEISLIENLQREDLNPIETAAAIKQLMEEYRYTQEVVAERIGKSRSAVANTLRLLTLSQPVIDFVARGELSPGHARCLCVVDDPVAQLNLAKQGVRDRVSAREFEKIVRQFLKPKKSAPTTAQQSVELRDLVERMQRVLSTKVSVFGNDHKGRIYIDYYHSDDLDRILELIQILEQRKA